MLLKYGPPGTSPAYLLVGRAGARRTICGDGITDSDTTKQLNHTVLLLSGPAGRGSRMASRIVIPSMSVMRMQTRFRMDHVNN